MGAICQVQACASRAHLALGDDGAVVSEQRKSVLQLQWDAGAAQCVDSTLQHKSVTQLGLCTLLGHTVLACLSDR
jgi:hypothetical protein